MHLLFSTVLKQKAFSLQCNTRILFKDDIFYLLLLFRGKKNRLLIHASKVLHDYLANTTQGNSTLHQAKQK